MAKEVSKAADEEDKISTRDEEALDKLLEDKDEAAVSTEVDSDELREDGKLTATGLDLESVRSDEAVLAAEVANELPDPDDDEAAVSVTVAGGGEGGGRGCSASGVGSITTTVVELFDSGRSGSKSIPSTGVTVQVVGVAAAILMADLNMGEAGASEKEVEVSDGSLDTEEVVVTSGLRVSKLMDEGAETVVILGDAALDDGAVLTGEGANTVCADGVCDKAAATIGGEATVGVTNEGAMAWGGAAVGVVKEDATVTLPEGGTTTGMENNGVTFIATIGREKWGAMLIEGGGVTEGMANLEVPLIGAGKPFKVDDLMSGAGAFVKLCALTCLAEFCKAGMADTVTMDGGSEMGKRFHGPGGKVSREDAAITAGGKVELERLRVEVAVFDLHCVPDWV